MAKHLYEFGPFRLDPGERRLLCDERPVALTPKCFDLLTALVENSGHLLEKDELLNRVWPNQFVEESNLSFNISTLRKALGDGQNGQRYIETVPKRGFRFVAPITVHREASSDLVGEDATKRGSSMSASEFEAKAAAFVEAPREASSHTRLSRNAVRMGIVAAIIACGILGLVLLRLSKRSTTPIGSPAKTLAVLPFKPLSADSRDESLEMGMAETLITRLSNVRQIVVRPMSAVRKYTDPQQDLVKAGQELQSEAVLDGSIQKSGDRIRVTVRLMNVQSGATLWTDQFDENFTNIFKVQDSISARVTNALLLRLSGDEQRQLTKRYTNNPEAYQLYLQGEHLRDKRDYNKSLEFYQRTIEKDPNFALAHIGLAESYMHLNAEGAPRIPIQETLPKIRAALIKALELDETLAEAHNTLAEIKYQLEYDWSGAEKEFQRAVELNPNAAYIRMAYGWYLMDEERFDEALPQMERAQELDPRNLLYQLSIGVFYYFRRDYDKALDRFQKILELEPNYPGAFWWIENIYQQKKMYPEALEYAMKTGLGSGKLKPEEVPGRREILKHSGWQGILRLWLDMAKERAKNEPANPRTFAVLYALLGDKDQAFAWLEKAVDAHDPWAVQLKIEPQYDSLRSDPRYTTLLKRLNMTP
jgi:DNA-binding winged helix-turn-helix (wHTH) protein/TolB-like protein